MWTEKTKPTDLEQLDPPLQGLFFYYGRLVNDLSFVEVDGKEVSAWEAKHPELNFPTDKVGDDLHWFNQYPIEKKSGVWRVYLRNLEGVSIPLFQTRDEGYRELAQYQSERGVLVEKQGDNILTFRCKDILLYTITYDNELHRIIDVQVEAMVDGVEIPKSDAIVPYSGREFSTEKMNLTELPTVWKWDVLAYAKQWRKEWEKYERHYDPSVHPKLIGFVLSVSVPHRLFEANPVYQTDNGTFAERHEDDGIMSWRVDPSDENFVAFGSDVE